MQTGNGMLSQIQTQYLTTMRCVRGTLIDLLQRRRGLERIMTKRKELPRLRKRRLRTPNDIR